MDYNINTSIHLKSGVYIVGRNTKTNLNATTKTKTKTKTKLCDMEPIEELRNISIIICGNGYDIFGVLNHDSGHDIVDYLYGVGRNNYGQCGVGNWNGVITKSLIKYFKQNNIKIIRVCASVTGESTFWISSKNTVFACGRNNKHQLGLPDDYTLNRNEPTLVKYLNNIIDIKCAFNYSLALGTINIDIIIEHWYRNIFINIRTTYDHVQTSVSGLFKLHIPLDIIHVISKFHGWSVYSTEYSLYGGNGHGANSTNNKRWKKIQSFCNIDIIKIETGYYHSLFLEANGYLWSCGDNDHGQCGRIVLVEKYKYIITKTN